MSIEFRNVSAGSLKEFTATAPNGAIISVVGGTFLDWISEWLKKPGN